MIVDRVQRWRAGRDLYRPAGEVVDTSRLEIHVTDSDNDAKRFVVDNHYSRSYPAARFRFMLNERGGRLLGVAVFSHPTNAFSLAPLPGTPPEVLADLLAQAQAARLAGDRKRLAEIEAKMKDPRVELGRFVLLNDDRVGANAETWFLARCFEILRARGIEGVVSFSDPFPRSSAAGNVVFGGHVGTIYQAHNAVYLGRARRDTVRLLPDGRTLHGRTIAKIRNGEQGWRYAVGQLAEIAGAVEPRTPLAAARWLEDNLPDLVRKVRHPGNHKYVWAFDRRVRKRIVRELEDREDGPPAYPKLVDILALARAA